MDKFTWSSYPESELDFESLMMAIDASIAADGLKVFQRPLHVGRKLWEAFGWGGNVFPPKEMAEAPGFGPDVIMAKAQRWYEQTYGPRLEGGFAYGYAPARLGNAIWRVRAGVSYGQVHFLIDRNLENQGVRLSLGGRPATNNILREVEGLSQQLASRLDDRALREFFDFYIFMFQSLQWRESLPKTHLLESAHADYDESTDALMQHRYGQSRWASEQAVEKTFKAFLALGGTKYPTGGAKGHDLHHLAKLLRESHNIDVPDAVLNIASCPPAARYNELPSTEEQALHANHAVLGMLERLRVSSEVAVLLERSRK